jgi:Tfp pilus assembly protein PilN
MRAVNLIPAEQRTGAELGVGRSQGGAYAVLAVIAGLAVMIVLYGKADHAISTKSAQAASLTQQAQTAETLASRLAPYTSFVAMREQREKAVETLLESRFDWAHVFHEFGRVLPAGTSVSSLDGTVGAKAAAVGSKAPIGSTAPAAGTVASSTPPGSVPTFTISGCAVGQAEVAELLERLRLIDGVSEVSLASSTSSNTAAGGGATGGCPAHDPSYTAQVTFEPLPASSAVAAATAPTKTVADSSGASATTKAATSGVRAR